MQVHQILIRPTENTVIILYHDLAGGRQSLAFDSAGNATIQAVVTLCQQRLPADADNPAKEEIQQEISSLEVRLRQLKQSIGVA